MNNKLLLTLISAGLITAGSASAAIIATEYFNGYGSSTVPLEGLNGGTGWDTATETAWGTSGNNPDFDSHYSPGAKLTYSDANYDTSVNLTGANDGGVVDVNNADNAAIGRVLDAPISGTFWISALGNQGGNASHTLLWLDVDKADNPTLSEDFIGVLSGEFEVRLNDTTSTHNVAASSTDTYLMLAKLTVGAGNDSIEYWYNPDLSTGEGGLGSANISGNSADYFGNDFGGIGVQMSNTGSMDAIRIGTTFADVTAVPEPSTYALLFGLGTLAFVMIRRKLRD